MEPPNRRASELTEWSFRRWDGRIDRAGFDCGEPVLNQWLREQAGQSERRDTARTYLAVDSAGELGGYVSLCLAQIDAADLNLPGLTDRYPISAVRLARLAVDVRYQGQGLGSYLLAQSVRLAHEVMERAAFQVLVVDALDAEVTAFYARWALHASGTTPAGCTSQQRRSGLQSMRPRSGSEL